MILLEDKKAVIITPPHTGSGSLHRQLCGQPGRYWVIGKSYDQFSDHHAAEIQPSWVEHDGYQVYVVWRNPLYRLYGLFKHYNWFASEYGQPRLNLREFRDQLKDLDWIYRTPIEQFAEDHIKYDFEYIPYRSLGQCMKREFDIDVKWKPSRDVRARKNVMQIFGGFHPMLLEHGLAKGIYTEWE